jgi:hypothetical protein
MTRAIRRIAMFNFLKKQEVKIGQRWQRKEYYKDEENPFDSKAGKYFIMTILDIKDGWALYRFTNDTCTGSEKISEIVKYYRLLKDGEKLQSKIKL